MKRAENLYSQKKLVQAQAQTDEIFEELNPPFLEKQEPNVPLPLPQEKLPEQQEDSLAKEIADELFDYLKSKKIDLQNPENQKKAIQVIKETVSQI